MPTTCLYPFHACLRMKPSQKIFDEFLTLPPTLPEEFVIIIITTTTTFFFLPSSERRTSRLQTLAGMRINLLSSVKDKRPHSLQQHQQPKWVRRF
ncbi:hypothetical protein CDAR_43831 [Caerostris darwini]|uniref:Uncharacterized protein n=1 Tax=Caerostris darwini TaxID=1538125 RepID=A0AAV4WI62_9ARAC|nr:hypothetical protein CDAR_43831 [Caerostris darwini]